MLPALPWTISSPSPRTSGVTSSSRGDRREGGRHRRARRPRRQARPPTSTLRPPPRRTLARRLVVRHRGRDLLRSAQHLSPGRGRLAARARAGAPEGSRHAAPGLGLRDPLHQQAQRSHQEEARLPPPRGPALLDHRPRGGDAGRLPLGPDGYIEVLAAERGERVRAEPFDAIPLHVGVLFGDEDDESPQET